MNIQSVTILEQMPIRKLIFKLSIPSLIGIICYNMYNIINTIYLSRGIGTFAAGGAAVTFPLFLFLFAIGSTLGAGSASIISRSIGENSRERAVRAAATTFVTFWMRALFITFFGLRYLDQLLGVMGVTKELIPCCISTLCVLYQNREAFKSN